MYCVLDIEASGFGSKSYPIEVGFVLPDQTAYCTLITPDPSWVHWDEKAERIHGINRETLHQHGRSVTNVAHELNRQLQGLTIYTDAWYHDYQWMCRLFEAADMHPQFKMDDIGRLLNESSQSQWHATKAQVQSELNLQRHRASGDAKILQITLQRVLSFA
jgi:hypothetical protein